MFVMLALNRFPPLAGIQALCLRCIYLPFLPKFSCLPTVMTSRPDLLPYLLLLFFPGFPVPSCRVCLQTWLPTIPLFPVHTRHSSP